MRQDEITGAFEFNGAEHDDVMKYMWAVFMDLSWYRIIEIIFRIVFKRPPKWVCYKPPEYYIRKSTDELNRMAGLKNRS